MIAAGEQICWGCHGTGRQQGKHCKVCFHGKSGTLPKDGRVKCWGCGGTGKQNGKNCKVCFFGDAGCLSADFVKDVQPCWGCQGTGQQHGANCKVCFHGRSGTLPKDGRVKCWGCGGTGMQNGKNCKVCFFGDAGCYLEDVNGQQSNVTQEVVSSREKRLDANTRILYHQTSKDAADAILQSGTMLRGSAGLAGGGIYFAETQAHTDHKAVHLGPILEVFVRLGRVKMLGPGGDPDTTFASLLAEGYDSVVIQRVNGLEYVVYNFDQATPLRIVRS